ncbi:outer membrane protein with beta-barrel domain [Maribacter caenipelagi]|jgi:opacity protein-like surface antigen|uniref:Outer membrane protein with beta-barrel domain n=1 Tax=Maribacter caenipelagi TaxID=1447781 RepID=A0A4R7D1U1_9FLAO|nr:outer membrane beta-barrel protein [Maribacter caenipelagi]TDS14222.1 outer membrane protein with beta-barrel domain [Maribacter caenipelagi]
MKQKLILFLTIINMGFLTHAQDEKLSVTVAYPLSVGDNFLANDNGIVDAGLQFRFLESSAFNFGLTANVGFFASSDNLGQFTIKNNVLLLQPRAYGEVNAETLNGFRPFFGLGYTIVNSSTKFNSDQTPDRSDSTGAINLNLGAAYDITNDLFAFVSYDYLNVSRDNPNQNNSFFETANVLKIGVGLRF